MGPSKRLIRKEQFGPRHLYTPPLSDALRIEFVRVSYRGWQYLSRGMSVACSFKSCFVLDPILPSGYLVMLLIVE